MSGELSNIQKQSLVGRIIEKLDAKDSQQGDNKIDVSIWNKFFGENSGREKTISKSEKNAELGETIDFKDAFDFVMKRLFNAAKQVLGNEVWNDADKAAEKEEAINKVAKEWLDEASKTDESDDKSKVDSAKDGKAAEKKEVSNDTKWSLAQLTSKDREALNSTKAGQIALNLDAQDGADGFIGKTAWNNFRKMAGIEDSSRTIDTRITLKNALRSINAYLNAAVRKANASKEEGAEEVTADSIADEWSAKYTGDKAFKQLTVEAIENPEATEEVEEKGETQEEETVKTPGQTAVENANNKIAGTVSSVISLQNLKTTAEGLIADAKAKASKEEAEAVLTRLNNEIRTQEKNLEALKNVLNEAKAEYKKAEESGEEALTDALEALSTKIDDLDAAIKDGALSIQASKTKLEAAQGIVAEKPTKAQVDADNLQTKIKAKIDDLVNTKKAKPQDQRMINGKEDVYYKYKDDNGVTHRVVINQVTGEPEELVIISDGLLKEKQFVTASALAEATKPKSVTTLPEGVKCECSVKDGNVQLTFKDKDGNKIESSNVRDYRPSEKAKKKEKTEQATETPSDKSGDNTLKKKTIDIIANDYLQLIKDNKEKANEESIQSRNKFIKNKQDNFKLGLGEPASGKTGIIESDNYTINFTARINMSDSTYYWDITNVIPKQKQ